MNRCINLGAGHDQLTGWETVDIDARFKPDHCFDLDMHHWPLPDNTYDYVRAYHVLEHLNNPLNAAIEICRILKDGGIFEMQLPHEKSPHATRDWSHKHTRWNKRKIEWLAEPTAYTNDDLQFELVEMTLETPWGKLKRWRFWREWWNWKHLFEYGNITASYRKVKHA